VRESGVMGVGKNVCVLIIINFINDNINFITVIL